ncbi:MAG: histidine--tRNA ligase [Bacteroidota bacterium]|nr:histidine--tRNA ligase [Bacteroidota bacterium]
MSNNIGIPKGTRDFGPDKMVKRNFIFDTIRKTFKKYGFMPLETPSMENLSVLMGKYGDEGDQLLFKILNSGDYLSGTTEGDFKAGAKALLTNISEKGLRYDLTVPFARYVVMNQHEITFPFKRYQIQPVWRADRPQKGRYREFYQCDADIVGTSSLICEAEIAAMILEVFDNLGIADYTIKLNNRKLLAGITEAIGAQGKESEFCVAIDKLDKIGAENVIKELSMKNFSEDALAKLKPILSITGDNASKIELMKQLLSNSELGMAGVNEIKEVLEYVQHLKVGASKIVLDLTLARGLSYYTGAIFEVKVNNVQIGSVSGGGRYDNLTGNFGLPGVSGVGISFGVDRIYDVMDTLDIFPESNQETTKVLFFNMDKNSSKFSLGIINELRKNNISSEIFPEDAKIKKQFQYAEKKAIPYAIIIGPEEISSGRYNLKNLKTGEQQQLTVGELINNLK